MCKTLLIIIIIIIAIINSLSKAVMPNSSRLINAMTFRSVIKLQPIVFTNKSIRKFSWRTVSIVIIQLPWIDSELIFPLRAFVYCFYFHGSIQVTNISQQVSANKKAFRAKVFLYHGRFLEKQNQEIGALSSSGEASLSSKTGLLNLEHTRNHKQDSVHFLEKWRLPVASLFHRIFMWPVQSKIFAEWDRAL